MTDGGKDERIKQLEEIGLELWQRAEHWKQTLNSIKSLTSDIVVISMIDKTLKGN